MLMKGILATQMSGSINGVTASRNRGGSYFRQRALPTNPQTSFQTAVRNAMATLSARWSQVLTAGEREGWKTYADNVSVTNRIGDQIFLQANAMYLRSNVSRLQAGLSIVDTAPAVFTLGILTDPSVVSLTASTDIFSIAFDNTDPWAGAVGGALLVYASRPVSPALTFYKGPYRFAGSVPGAGSPPASPQPITGPFNYTAGQAAFVQFRSTDAVGRLSGVFRVRTVAV